MVYINELTDNHKEYTASCFCGYCRDYVKYKERTRKEHKTMLPPKARTSAIANSAAILQNIFTPRFLTTDNEPVFFEEAFRRIGGWNTKREFRIPAYNTWNNRAGSFLFTHTECVYPLDPNAQAGLLSTKYKPKKLVITDNPEQALAIRYATTASTKIKKDPYAVMILIPGKLPCLRALQNPDKVIVFVDNPAIRLSLMEILPRDAILSNRSINVKPGVLINVLLGAEKPLVALEDL